MTIKYAATAVERQIKITEEAGRIENLGAPIHNSTSHAAVFTKSEDGRDIMYLSLDGSAGEDARLGTIDLNEERLVHILPMPGAMGGFSMTKAGDESIYVATHNQGNVYRYTPWNRKLEVLGRPTPETTFGYALTSVGEDAVFGGTYPGAVFYQYRPGEGFKLFGSQPFEPGEHYVRSLAHWPEAGVTYVGIGSHPRLKRFNHRTGEVKELLPEAYYNDEFVYDLNIEGGTLFVRLNPSNRLLVYDLSMDDSGKCTEKFEREVPGVNSLGVSPLYAGAVYYTYIGKLYRYELDSGRSVSLDVDTTILPFKLDFVELADQQQFPGKTLVGVGSRLGRTRLFKYNPQNGNLRISDLEIEGVPTNVQSIATASDGRLYIGAFLVGGTSIFDPESDTFTEYKGVGQTENTAELDGRLYFSAYPHAKLFEYDPAKEWTLSRHTDEPNPRLLFDLSAEEQDRPYGLAVGRGKLYIGTICGYGKRGGAIISYDPRTGERCVYRNPLPDLSIVALVYANDKLYAGTNIWCGLGIMPSRKEAELLVFDPERGEARGIPLPVPELRAITALIEGQDGQLWGMAEGWLFVFNPRTETYTHMAHLFPEIDYRESIWRDASLKFGRDGRLYGTIQGRYFFAYDPDHRKLDIIAEDGARFLADDRQGRLYFSDGKTRIRRYSPQ